MTTPYEREILTHFYISSGPFPRADAPEYRRTVHRFVKLGLLKYDPANNDEWAPIGVKPALDAYMAALAAVPLPTCEWSCKPKLRAFGWAEDALQPGDVFTVEGGLHGTVPLSAKMIEQGPCPQCHTRWLANELLPCPTCNRHLYPLHVPVSELRR